MNSILDFPHNAIPHFRVRGYRGDDSSTRLHVPGSLTPGGDPSPDFAANSGAPLAGLSNAHIWANRVSNSRNAPPLPAKTQIYRRDNSLEKVGVRDSGTPTIFHIGASLIESRRTPLLSLVSGGMQVGGGRRSVVSGFSANSRRRLMVQLAKVRRSEVPIFITLTYPGVWPSSPTEWKKHLHNWRRELFRRFPDSSMIWKLEPQRRGAPHFHVFLFGLRVITPDFRDFVSASWYKAVGSGDLRHLRAGTRVEYLRSVQGAFSYAAKYFGKIVSDDDGVWGRPGRFWGVYGRERLPVGEVFVVPLSWLESVDLQRFLRRYSKIPASGRPLLRVFVQSPEQWLRVLDICGSLDPPPIPEFS